LPSAQLTVDTRQTGTQQGRDAPPTP